MPAAVRTAVIAPAALLVLLLAPAAQARCPDADLIPAPHDVDAYETAVVCLVNAEREARDRQPLQRERRLRWGAERHAADMVLRDYFSHDSPAGADVVDRLRRVGYVPRLRWYLVGELLAVGSLWRATPRAIVDGWLASPPHREELLEPRYLQVGAGAVADDPLGSALPGVTVTVTLGRRAAEPLAR